MTNSMVGKKGRRSKKMSKTRSIKLSEQPTVLREMIDDYLDYIKDTTDICKINRSVNLKLNDILIGDNINDKNKLEKLNNSIQNTIGNDIPKQKLIEHCGDKSDKMLEKISNAMKKSINAFGKRRKSRKSRKSGRK
jgi:hypothetical protein